MLFHGFIVIQFKSEIKVGWQMFKGPIFIVGRPRSGTKLLRSLLNSHSAISIPGWESNFIPQNIQKVKSFGDLADPSNFEAFFQYIVNHGFFRRILNHNDYKEIVSITKWYEKLECYTYAGAIEAFFTLYAEKEKKRIWGDKSPHYMLYINEIKGMFPSAKFIHIIRDVRDHCLSSKKLWNKNPYRASKMWRDSIVKCKSDAALHLKNDYYEVKYEELIENTEALLAGICEFIGVEYEKEMVNLNKPAENLGDTKLTKEIVKTNKNKWNKELSVKIIKRIEEISFDVMRDLDYDISLATCQIPMSRSELIMTRALDSFNRFMFDCKFQGGMLKGIKYQYNKRKFG